jgi:hypothetical protein
MRLSLKSSTLSCLLLLSATLHGCDDKSTVSADAPATKMFRSLSLGLTGKEDSVLSADLPKLFYPGSGYPPYAFRILDTATPGARVEISEGILQAHPDPNFSGGITIRLDVIDSSQEPYLDSNRHPVRDVIQLTFLPVNDPPRSVKAQADTSIHFLDTLRLNLKAYFHDVDDADLRYKVVLDSGAIKFALKDTLAFFSMGKSLLPVPVRIFASDGSLNSDTLAFNLDPNGPARMGAKLPLPIQMISFAEIRPWLFMENSDRGTLALFTGDEILFLDSYGRIKEKSSRYDRFLYGPEWGFENHSLFFRKTGSPLDSMLWLTESSQGARISGFGFDPGPRGYTPISVYSPIGPGSSSDYLFLHTVSDNKTLPRSSVFRIAVYSGNAVTDGPQLAIPTDAYIQKAMLYGNKVAVFWRRAIDSYNSSELAVGFFSADGAPLAAPRILTTYLPGSQPRYRNNHRSFLDAFVCNGRLEILHCTANVLEPSGGAIGHIDQALLRTVIDADMAVILDSQPVTGVKPGSYGDLFPILWQPVSATSYRIYWANLGSAGGMSTGGSVVVDAVGNLYSNPADYAPETFAVEYRFSDGRSLQVTVGKGGIPIGEFTPGPVVP